MTGKHKSRGDGAEGICQSLMCMMFVLMVTMQNRQETKPTQGGNKTLQRAGSPKAELLSDMVHCSTPAPPHTHTQVRVENEREGEYQ